MYGIFDDHFPVRIHAFEDFQVSEFRDVVGDGILWMPFALFVENHHGHAGDDLGHGEYAKDCVGGHGRAAGEIFLAVGFQVDELAMAHEERDGAGHGLFLIDFLLHGGVETLEAFGGEAQRFGFCRSGRGSGLRPICSPDCCGKDQRGKVNGSPVAEERRAVFEVSFAFSCSIKIHYATG